MVADYFHICPCGKKSQKEIRPGNIHTLGDFDRASALSMVRVLWGELPHRPGLLTGPSAVSAASACERTALRGISAATLLSSRAQARSAPRAHVRELLCVSQSSKEQLRRSRTESSGAAPAIEELAGEARQVRPAGPRADSYQPTPGLLTGGEVWRASGPPAPPTGKLAAAACLSPPLPTAYHRSRNFPPRYRFRLSGRSGGRPALQFP